VVEARWRQHLHHCRCMCQLAPHRVTYVRLTHPFFRQELFENNHRIVSQRGGSGGRFTFTAHEAGDHKICFTPSSDSGKTGWLSTSNPNGGIKLTLDMTIGETSAIESSDKDKLEDIQSRIKDLNSRLQDIRREQVFQRVRLP
jgi:p24 family protein alpha